MNIEIKLRRASLIVAFGLLLQFLSLLPLHPLAFIAFVGLGVPVTALGVGIYLLSLVHHTESPELRETTQRPPRMTQPGNG